MERIKMDLLENTETSFSLNSNIGLPTDLLYMAMIEVFDQRLLAEAVGVWRLFQVQNNMDCSSTMSSMNTDPSVYTSSYCLSKQTKQRIRWKLAPCHGVL